MKRLWHIVLWITGGILALLALVIGAAVIFTRTAAFNNFIRVQIVNYLAQTYRGSITIGTIEGSIWGRLTLHDIEVHRAGAAIAVIRQLRVGYRILPALRGQIVLSDIDAVDPDLHLARDPDGRWNLLAALEERHPNNSSSSFNIDLRRFSIEHARATIAAQPALAYRLSDGSIQGYGRMGLSGQDFNLDKISFALSGPQIPPLRAEGGVRYHEAAQVAAISVPNLSLKTAHSRVDFSGTLRDLSEKNVNAVIHLRQLSAIDVNTLAPQAGLARDISGTVHVNGKASDLQAEAILAAAGARLKAAVRADIASSQPAWQLNLRLSG